MQSPAPLEPGKYCHIYNRGNNHEDLFREERNYPFFLALYTRHIEPVAETFAYCLLRNHFHLLVRIRDTDTHMTSPADLSCVNGAARSPSQCFANLFNAYARAINKTYNRSGALFERPFGRIEVKNDCYFTNLIYYIHFNPQKHGFVADFRDWSYSSYHAMTSIHATKVKRCEVLQWSGGVDALLKSHLQGMPVKDIQPLMSDDFDG